MTDLKARAREIADELASEFLRNYIPKSVWHAKVESALLQFVAEAQQIELKQTCKTCESLARWESLMKCDRRGME